MDDIAFTDDPKQLRSLVHDQDGPDPAVAHGLDNHPDRRFRPDADYIRTFDLEDGRDAHHLLPAWLFIRPRSPCGGLRTKAPRSTLDVGFNRSDIHTAVIKPAWQVPASFP